MVRRYWYQGRDYPKDEFGFVVDPTSPQGFGADRELKTLDELASKDVLILLGSPGMGKTTELRLLAEQLSHRRLPDTAIIFRLLGDFGDEEKLVSDISDQADQSPNCTLILDALDEWRGHPPDLWRRLGRFQDQFQVQNPIENWVLPQK